MGLRSSKSVSPSCARETVSGAKSVSWLQSRSAAFCRGKRVRGGRRDFYQVWIPAAQNCPPCFFTRIILTRAVRDPPQRMGEQDRFFGREGQRVLEAYSKLSKPPVVIVAEDHFGAGVDSDVWTTPSKNLRANVLIHFVTISLSRNSKGFAWGSSRRACSPAAGCKRFPVLFIENLAPRPRAVNLAPV